MHEMGSIPGPPDSLDSSSSHNQKLLSKMQRMSSRLREQATHLPEVLQNTPEVHARLFDDKVFDWTDWKKHRSAAWRHRVQPIIFLRVALGFIWQLVYVVIVAVLVGLYHEIFVPMGAPPTSPQLSTPFNMITFALSLLLVFKTNSSYSRWWEGRIMWGQVVNVARNLPRMALSWAHPGQQHEEACRVLLRWVAAAPHVMRGHIKESLVGRCTTAADHLLSEAEQEWLARWRNGPVGVAYMLSWLVSHTLGPLDGQKAAALQAEVSLYMNMSGGCERIQKTPIPSAYTRHTSRFLMLYVILSPIMLWPAVGWATPAVAATIAFLLLGTENIGVQIEEPFRVLSLDAICGAAEANLRELEVAHFGDAPGAPTLQPPTTPRRGSAHQHHTHATGTGVGLWEVVGLEPPAPPTMPHMAWMPPHGGGPAPYPTPAPAYVYSNAQYALPGVQLPPGPRFPAPYNHPEQGVMGPGGPGVVRVWQGQGQEGAGAGRARGPSPDLGAGGGRAGQGGALSRSRPVSSAGAVMAPMLQPPQHPAHMQGTAPHMPEGGTAGGSVVRPQALSSPSQPASSHTPSSHAVTGPYPPPAPSAPSVSDSPQGIGGSMVSPSLTYLLPLAAQLGVLQGKAGGEHGQHGSGGPGSAAAAATAMGRRPSHPVTIQLAATSAPAPAMGAAYGLQSGRVEGVDPFGAAARGPGGASLTGAGARAGAGAGTGAGALSPSSGEEEGAETAGSGFGSPSSAFGTPASSWARTPSRCSSIGGGGLLAAAPQLLPTPSAGSGLGAQAAGAERRGGGGGGPLGPVGGNSGALGGSPSQEVGWQG